MLYLSKSINSHFGNNGNRQITGASAFDKQKQGDVFLHTSAVSIHMETVYGVNNNNGTYF